MRKTCLAVAGFFAMTGYAQAEYVTQKGAIMCPALIALQEVAAHAKAGPDVLTQSMNEHHCFVAKEGIIVAPTANESGRDAIEVSIRLANGRYQDFWTVRGAIRER